MSNRAPEVVQLEAIETLSLAVQGGPEHAGNAFQQLEEIVPLKGRHFYGIFEMASGIYRVSTRIEGVDEEQGWNLESYTIPEGIYAYRKIRGEHDELAQQIPEVFQQLAGRYAIDLSRPSIEFYRRLDEFRLYLPIKQG